MLEHKQYSLCKPCMFDYCRLSLKYFDYTEDSKHSEATVRMRVYRIIRNSESDVPMAKHWSKQKKDELC